ncbi:beta-N-acetylhexosaminidase [Bowmanella sp. Y26]|uniref:beta-N-acetylhexosaminidase n=1 Tax=Bowmanella yangjiangensis TaxID=2811230 RepID=UPI001BDD67E4|nr:beta-N-acetylhexosaminidase [Bowmanella yangjiangensis]MBT1063191.1 beta-N-acetylhexosaminidase [Bowmanella yangjiangensis]
MGPLMLDLAGHELSGEEKEILDHPLVGGVMLTSRNIYDLKQLSELIGQTRTHARNTLLIGVEQEGGDHQILRSGLSPLPPLSVLFRYAEGQLDKACHLAQQVGWLTAAELLALDIDLAFGPVLDILGPSPLVADRAFHSKSQQVIEMAASYAKGMQQAGMKTVGKHFPGLGYVLDVEKRIDPRPLAEIRHHDLRVFQAMQEQKLLDAVMVAHVVYPAVDKLLACYSRRWLRDILRKELDFDGVVFSGNLSASVSHTREFSERARQALDAGCDMVLVCGNRDGAIAVLDALPSSYQASSRLNALRKSDAPGLSALRTKTLWQTANSAMETLHAG